MTAPTSCGTSVEARRPGASNGLRRTARAGDFDGVGGDPHDKVDDVVVRGGDRIDAVEIEEDGACEPAKSFVAAVTAPVRPATGVFPGSG